MHEHEVELTIEAEAETETDAEPSDGGDASERLLALVSGQEELPLEPVAIPARIAGVVLGRVVRVDPLVVAWAGAPEGVSVRSLVPVDATGIGRTVAIQFENHDPSLPLVTGIVEELPLPDAPRAAGEPGAAISGGLAVEIEGSKRRVVVSSEDELVLRCGKASITLTRAGKILIRGAYVSSTASGTHRIRGGTVEIN